jgi:uncharacterized protein YjbI with pentapeptide repeats
LIGPERILRLVHLDRLTLTPDEAADGESWEAVQIVDTELPGIDARSLGFVEARFEATDLSGAKLTGLFLSECELSRCDLSNAVVRGGSARRTKVEAGRLTGLSWTAGEMSDTTFSECRANLTTFEGTKFDRVVFENCDLGEADFRQCRFESVAFRGCDLSRADLVNARFTGKCEMSGCTLEGLRGVDRLRGVAMPWPDILAAAGVFAGELGVTLLEGDE